MAVLNEMFDLIKELFEGGSKTEVIVDDLVYTYGISKTEAKELVTDWLDDHNKNYEDVSNGDLEAKFEELVEEGFEDFEALAILKKKTGYTTKELKSILADYF